MRNLTKWLSTVLGVILLTGVVALPRIEQAYAPETANIKDLGDTLWYALVTLTTVGYGDVYPITAPGQVIGAIFVLSSLGVLGLLIGKLADVFTSYRERRRLGHHGTDARGHLVIFGWNQSTQRIIEQMRALGRRIVVVTNDRASIDTVHDRFSDSVFPLYAEYDDATLLKRINLQAADRVLFNIGSDTDTLIYLLNLRKHFPEVNFVVAAQNAELQDTFQNAGVARVVSSEANAAHLIASVIFEPDVAMFAQELITTAHGDDEYDLQQYRVQANSRLANETYGTVFRDLYTELRVVPIGLSKPENEDRRLRKLPSDDVSVDPDDILVMIARGRDEAELDDGWGLSSTGHPHTPAAS